jgi:hypothetical protein
MLDAGLIFELSLFTFHFSFIQHPASSIQYPVSLSNYLKLCAPVVGAAGFGIIRVDGTGHSKACKSKAVFRDAIINKVEVNRLGSVF